MTYTGAGNIFLVQRLAAPGPHLARSKLATFTAPPSVQVARLVHSAGVPAATHSGCDLHCSRAEVGDLLKPARSLLSKSQQQLLASSWHRVAVEGGSWVCLLQDSCACIQAAHRERYHTPRVAAKETPKPHLLQSVAP